MLGRRHVHCLDTGQNPDATTSDRSHRGSSTFDANAAWGHRDQPTSPTLSRGFRTMVSRFMKFAAVATLIALPTVAQAQLVCVGAPSCSINPSASLTIPKVVRLASTVSAITLTTPVFTTDSLSNQAVATTFNGLNV